MPIGDTPTTPFQLNNQAAQLARQLRTLMDAISVFSGWVAGQGARGLQDNLGFTSDDANAMLTQASYLSTFPLIYHGQLQQGGTGGTGAITFNFADALKALTGPT
jgi:hypothetical protein